MIQIFDSSPGDKTFSVVLTNATLPGRLVPPSVQTVNIIDSNSRVSFSSPAYAVSKTGIQATINVNRTGYIAGYMTVDYAATDGTATNGYDYLATNGTLLFLPGVTNQTFTVTVINQGVTQPPKTVLLSLFNEINAVPVAPTNAVLTILDNNNPAIAFAAASNTVPGTVGSVALSVLRLSNTNGMVTVDYATTNGTATAGNNYLATNGTLTFLPGVALQTVIVPVIANTNFTGNLQFGVMLANAGGGAQLIAPSNETVTIQYAPPANVPPSIQNPILIRGDWGSSSFDNGPAYANFGSQGQLIFYSWTATNSGEVVFDTFGSVDDVTGFTNLSTYMGVFTGVASDTNFSSVNWVTVNTGINPYAQEFLYSGQDVFNMAGENPLNLLNPLNPNTNTVPVCQALYGYFTQPFTGPSQVRFNAVAGQSYYIVVETLPNLLNEWESYPLSGNAFQSLYDSIYSPPAGLIKLNWALHPSGVFRFASEDLDVTGMTYSNGIPMLLYRVSETEGTRRPTGTVNVDQFNSTLYGTVYRNNTNANSGYTFDVPGLLVTVTRVGGSSGRVQVGYTTANIPTNSIWMATNGTGYLVNGDLPASSFATNYLVAAGTNVFVVGTNQFVTTNYTIVSAPQDYVPVSGTLTFDDSEVSKTIFIPVADDSGLPRQNRDFLLVLTNAALDAEESSDVQPPRLDNVFSQTLVRILDADISPQGPSFGGTTIATNVVTNIVTSIVTTNTTTNIVWNIQPTNGVFNFSKAHYRVTRDISDYWGATPITLYVNRMGTNDAASPTIHWRVNHYYLERTGSDLLNGQFPLQPGSDYATPEPVNNTGIKGLVHDFDMSAYSGTISWPSGNGAFNPQPITFTVYNNGLQQFNEDFLVSLYYEDSHNATFPVGMIDQATVTILFDDNHPPAGSVDELYNADFSYNMAAPFPTVPANMSHPGTDGEVFGLAVQPDDKTILVGDFFSYDSTARNCIARANLNGSLDTTFNPGSGANDFISCIALTTNYEAIVGGNFTSYNGSLRKGIALVNTDGSLDTGFNPGLGFNGTVNAVAIQPDSRILVGGNFTSYNGTPRKYLARLNTDGSLDSTFDPGNSLNGAVNAITVQGNATINVDRNAIGTDPEDDNTVFVGSSSGTLTVMYDFLAVPDDMRIFYGTTNVAGGQGVLIYDTGLISTYNTNTFLDYFLTNTISFGPTNGLTTNIITIVMNQGNGIPGTAWEYTAQVFVAGSGRMVVGGNFTSAGGIPGQDYIARFTDDGSFDTTFNPGSGAERSGFCPGDTAGRQYCGWR